MRHFHRSLVATAVAFALAASGNAAAQFTGVHFFGDSLTDMGTFMPVLPPGTGLFTTNPGPVWAQPFAQHFGFSAIPANQGGTDHAEGGARVTQVPGYPPIPPTRGAAPIATQITQALSSGPVDSRAIYSVWGGGNDIFTQIDDFVAGRVTIPQLQTNIVNAGSEVAQQVARLRSAGARYIMVWNMPDIGATPFGIGSGVAPLLTLITDLFNTSLIAGLDASGVQTIRLNPNRLYQEVMANPAAFGLQNVTASACGDATPSVLCTSANFVTPDAPQTYLWATDVHPSTAGHAILAQYAESMIEAPLRIATLPLAPFAVEDANFRALDGRMWSSLNAPRSPKKIDMWAAYDYGSSDLAGGAGDGTARTNTIAVGADTKLSDKLLIGGSFGYSENKGDFGGEGGGYKLRQPTGTFYAGYGEGPWYVGATLGAGALDYSDVNRNIVLGTGVRNESGQTRGYEYTGRLLGGYWLRYQDVLHGPYARVAYTKSVVYAYSETGSNSTTLAYGQQDRGQLLWSLGWQVAGTIASIRPFARVTWEYDSMDQTPSVTASSATLGDNYTIQGTQPDNSYALFNAGASADFGGVTGFVTGSGTAGRGDGNYWAVTVGLRLPI